MKTLFTAALIGLCATLTTAQEDYSSWAHTKAITLNTSATGANVAGAVGGFPVLVRLTSAHAEIFTQAKGNGADIRFRRLPGPSLPYQIERWDSAGQSADIWVRLDTVMGNNSTQTFNIYWGKASAGDSSNGAKTFDAAGGYQGVWHLNNSTNDATVNAIHGVDEGTSDIAGAIGRGRDFNGSSRITLGNNPLMSSGDADRFTVESWANWSSIGTGASDRYRCIINHGTTNNADQFFMYARNPSSGGTDPHYSFGYYTGSSSNAALGYGIAADAGVWTHVSGVYDGNEWRVYRNGVLAATAAKSGSPVNSAADWIIGAWGTSRYFLGGLDEIRFSNKVRSDDWIKLSYETQKSGATALTFGATTTPAAIQGVPGFFGSNSWVRSSVTGLVFRLPAGNGTASLSVLDLKGRVLWSREANLGAAETTLSREGVQPGTYIARLTVRESGAPERTQQQQISISR
jgi:hypothetical protein